MMTRQILRAALPAVGVLLLLAGALWAGVGSEPVSSTGIGTALRIEGALPSLSGATEWLNSPRLSNHELRGKVVLVEFGTYTCINWRRTLPYVRAWARKYNQGLVVIVVHTPEFSFEGDRDNVRDAVQELGIEFPVAVDSDHAIWRAFNNQYWPAMYLADAQGHIRYRQFGEGNYQETELAIQELLAEAGQANFRRGLESIDPQGAEVAADWHNLKSQETYTGYELMRGFASPGGASEDRTRIYGVPSRLNLNQWALAGGWTIGREGERVSK